MMPSRIISNSTATENPLHLSWHDSAWNSVNASNVLDYFSEKSNPFYDPHCNNENIKMQRLNPDQLRNLTGTEYVLLHVQEPILYVIRKQHRTGPDHTIPLAHYYIIDKVVYQAPDLVSVINSRLLSTASNLISAFDDLNGLMRYEPSKGYSWNIKANTSPSDKNKSDKDVEPTTHFQKSRVDSLLRELIKHFPIPNQITEVPASNGTHDTEHGNIVKLEKMDDCSKNDDNTDTIMTSPSIKPPPEKKMRLNT